MLAAGLHSDPELLAGATTTTLLRNDLSAHLVGAAAAAADGCPADDPVVGTLRVRVLEAEGLATRPGGAPCVPYATVAVTELTRRRTRRTSAAASGPTASWDESFEFEQTSSDAQVVVDVWDRSDRGGPSDLLGKVVIGVGECRLGVPHTFLKHLLEGKVALRLTFDTKPLPDDSAQLRELLGQHPLGR